MRNGRCWIPIFPGPAFDRPSPHHGPSGSLERDPVHGQHRLPMARLPQGFFHRLRRFRTISTAGRKGDGWRSFCGRFGGRRVSMRDARKSRRRVRLIARAPGTTESGGPRGSDAGKKVKGRKRHLVVDTEGNPLTVQIHAASIQDRDGRAFVFLRRLRLTFCG